MNDNKIAITVRLNPKTVDKILDAESKTNKTKSKIIRKVFKMIEDGKIQAKSELLNEDEKIIWAIL